MVGEKHVPIKQFGQGWFDNCYYNGDYPFATLRAAGPEYPLAQWPTDPPTLGFGSYHTGICPFAFCDGSVRALYNSIDPAVLGLLAARSDGQVIPNS
jgi:hypothetical protein